jgi:HPt (histidine-containing phosphotransfer) domain-containing protein
VCSSDLNPDALYATLFRWLPKRGAASPAPTLPAVLIPAPYDQIAAWPNFDFERAITSVGGKAEKLPRILAKFASVHRGDVSLLRGHMGQNRIEEAIRLIHTLKGVSATLGFTLLHEHALALEQALKHGDPSEAQIAALASSLYAALDCVAQLQTHPV